MHCKATFFFFSNVLVKSSVMNPLSSVRITHLRILSLRRHLWIPGYKQLLVGRSLAGTCSSCHALICRTPQPAEHPVNVTKIALRRQRLIKTMFTDDSIETKNQSCMSVAMETMNHPRKATPVLETMKTEKFWKLCPADTNMCRKYVTLYWVKNWTFLTL